MQQQAQIGIIGGSGLYAMPGLTDTHEQTLHTRGQERPVPPERFFAKGFAMHVSL